MSTKVNKWKALLLEGWPVLYMGRKLTELKEGEPDMALSVEICIESDRTGKDQLDTLHQLLKKALGRGGYRKARGAALGGEEWDEEIRYMCRRAAMQACYQMFPLERSGIERIDRQVEYLLRTADEIHDEHRKELIEYLIKTSTYNQLPC